MYSNSLIENDWADLSRICLFVIAVRRFLEKKILRKASVKRKSKVVF